MALYQMKRALQHYFWWHWRLLWVLFGWLTVVNAQAATLYYDPVSGRMVSQPMVQAEASVLIFEVRLNQNLLLGEIEVLQEGQQVWVTPEAVIQTLSLPIQVTQTPKKLEASGWFLKPQQKVSLQLSAQGGTLQVGDRQQTLSASQVKYWQHQWWMPLATAFDGFQVQATVKRADLLLHLQTQAPLPIILKQQRRQKQKANRQRLRVQQPDQTPPYQLLSPVFTDVQLGIRRDTLAQHQATVSVLSAGDLGYMTGRYFLSHRYDERTDQQQDTLRLQLERQSRHARLLGSLHASQISLGDIYSVPMSNLSSSSGLGVRLNNRPLGQVVTQRQVTLSGLQQPGWEVELYWNDLFLDSVTVDETGQYQFENIPLDVGQNHFVLRFYGPQGQVVEKTEDYFVNPNAVQGKLIYDFSLVQPHREIADLWQSTPKTASSWRQDLHLEMHPFANLALETDFSHYTFQNGRDHTFVQPGVSLGWGRQWLSLKQLRDLEAGAQTTLNYSLQWGAVAKRQGIQWQVLHQSSDWQPDGVVTSPKVWQSTLSYKNIAFYRSSHALPFQVKLTGSEDEARLRQQGAQVDVGVNWQHWLINPSWRYAYAKRPQQAATETADGALRVRRVFAHWLWRGAVQYDLHPQQVVTALNSSVNIALNAHWQTELGIDYQWASQKTSHSARLNWKTKQWASSLQVQHYDGYWSGMWSLRFSFGHDPLGQNWFASALPLTQSGAVSAVVFEDLNNNHRWDPGERPIEGAKVVAVQQHRSARSNAQGLLLLPRLQKMQPTDIELEESSLEDAYWLPQFSPFSVTPRPGMVKLVAIPVVVAGEVEGVTLRDQAVDTPPLPQGGVPLVLTHLKTGKIWRQRSSYDGYYVFEKLPPGTYRLQVDDAFLQRQKLKTRSPIRLKIRADGTLVTAANFILYAPENYHPDPVSETGQYWVDLGRYLTADNAKLILQALRAKFAEVWRHQSPSAPYQVRLVKTEDQQYQLQLHGITQLNLAKYLCGNLMQENLTCRIYKISKKKAVLLGSRSTHETSAQAQSYWTLQLVTVSTYTQAQRFIQTHHIKQAKIVPLKAKGATLYRVQLGEYLSRAEAQKQAEHLKNTRHMTPWIKYIDTTQRRM